MVHIRLAGAVKTLPATGVKGVSESKGLDVVGEKAYLEGGSYGGGSVAMRQQRQCILAAI